MVLNGKRARIVAPSVNTEADIIVPKTSGKSSVVKHIYQIYKDEGARKLTERINIQHSGISKEFIQNWLNNKEHFRRLPLFTNKPPLLLIIANTTQFKVSDII